MQEVIDHHHEHRGKQFFGLHPFSNLLTEFDLAIAAGVLRRGLRPFLKWVGGARPVTLNRATLIRTFRSRKWRNWQTRRP